VTVQRNRLPAASKVNEGPACNGVPPEWCESLYASASAYNSAGEVVWDDSAGKTIPGQITCPFVPAPGPQWPAHYSSTQELSWRQDRCALAGETGQPGHRNLNCPGTQVPAGPYRIVGNQMSAPVTITIAG
jgi:hypothetical protein